MLGQAITVMSKSQGLGDTKPPFALGPITNHYAHYAPKMHEQGFTVLPITPDNKFPAVPTSSEGEDGKRVVTWRPLYGWQGGFRLLDDATAGMMGNSSIGILSGHGEDPVIAVDIDVMDKSHVDMIRRCAIEHLGRRR
jgi:hypothetical protein